MSSGYDNLITLDSNIQKKVYVSSETRDVETIKTNLSCGVFEFEAWMRMLDSQVMYRTPGKLASSAVFLTLFPF